MLAIDAHIPPIADVQEGLVWRRMEARKAAERTCAWPSTKRSLLVALVMGTILNLINQGEILAGRPLVFWKLALTFIVPFLVASYGSYAAFRRSR